MGHVTEISRHPIKAHGREALTSVTLTAGQTMPWDRVWAVAHEATKFNPDAPEWTACHSFTIGSKAHGLMAIQARMDPSTNTVHLSHPDLDDLSVNPDTDAGAAALIAWAGRFVPENRAASSFVAKLPDRGMTDTEFPSISILNHATLNELSTKAGTTLSIDRWRGNIWIDGFDPWAEFDWIGRDLHIGTCRLNISERITRCRATTVDPKTGISNVDTLGILKSEYGHQNFGIYAVVVETGLINIGDTVEVLT